jgi:hypothetical protein
LAGESYDYTSCGGFEYTGTAGDGRNINHYPLSRFPTKGEWGPGSGMLNTPYTGENYGDIPAPFVYTNKNTLNSGTKITLGTASITISESCKDIEWDSKSGLVTGVVGSTRRPIAYSGNSLATIPVGDNNKISTASPSGGVLKYNYWYY